MSRPSTAPSRPTVAVLGFALGIAAAVALGIHRAPPAAEAAAPQEETAADLGAFLSASGTEIRLLLSESNLGGGELQVGEITFPPGTDSGDHRHGATEVFYVLSGELEHVVDGVSETLGPGDLGFVRPPSRVNHRTDPDGPPVKALVIWAPGGEGTRIVETWRRP